MFIHCPHVSFIGVYQVFDKMLKWHFGIVLDSNEFQTLEIIIIRLVYHILIICCVFYTLDALHMHHDETWARQSSTQMDPSLHLNTYVDNRVGPSNMDIDAVPVTTSPTPKLEWRERCSKRELAELSQNIFRTFCW